jgi:hypothetical protein
MFPVRDLSPANLFRSTSSHPGSFRPALIGLLLLAFCTACADLSAISKFADAAKTASTGYSDIAKDFAASAARRAHYEDKTGTTDEESKYKALEPDLLAAEKPLNDYVAALAAIATDSTTSRDTSIGATQSGLVKIGMSSDQATAATGLAGKVVDALTAGYRSNKAGKIIKECNPLLQDYLKGLEHIVGTDYAQLLTAEQIAAEGYYDGLLHEYGNKEPLAAVSIRVLRQTDLDAIAKKQDAAKAYLKILADIGDAHQKLYDSEEHTSAKALAKLIEPYVKDIATQSVQVAKAY